MAAEATTEGLALQGIRSLEFGVGGRAIGVFMIDGTRFELKNIGQLAKDGITLIVKFDSKAQVLKDVDEVKLAAAGSADLVRQGLARLQYVFRGRELQMAPAVAELKATIIKALEKQFPIVADEVARDQIKLIRYLNRDVPF